MRSPFQVFSSITSVSFVHGCLPMHFRHLPGVHTNDRTFVHIRCTSSVFERQLEWTTVLACESIHPFQANVGASAQAPPSDTFVARARTTLGKRSRENGNEFTYLVVPSRYAFVAS
eukprot:scaffold241_cov340-Pavlova_lutheri.AAC.39